MEIKDMEQFLKGKKQISLEDAIKHANSGGFSLNNIVKSLILTLKETKPEKYLELKNAYLNDAVKKAEEENLKGYGKQKLALIKNMHELEIEILKAKLEVVNKKLEG